MEVLGKCQQNLSAQVQRTHRYEVHQMGFTFKGAEVRQWVPRFGLAKKDFLDLLRFWLYLGYELEDCWSRPITRDTPLRHIADACDLHAPVEESAGGVWVIVRRPLRFH